MKFSSRVILTITLISLLTATVSVIGVLTYRNNRNNVLGLLLGRLSTLSALANEQITEFLEDAANQTRLTVGLIESGQLSVGDFQGIGRYWVEVMHVHENLTYLSLGLEESGEYLHVTRTEDGRLSIRELRRSPDTGELELNDYWPDGYPGIPYSTDPAGDKGDPRLRPYYRQAKEVGTPSWTETYMFLGADGDPDIPGVTYANPLFDDSGKFVGVMTADFDLRAISEFLRERQQRGRPGVMMLVEMREDGSRRLIGHPHFTSIVRRAVGRIAAYDLLSAEGIPNPELRGFFGVIPDDLDLENLGDPELLRFDSEGVRYLGTFFPLLYPDGPKWLICGFAKRDQVMGAVFRNNLITALTGFVGFFVAVLIGFFVSSGFSKPLRKVAEDASRVGKGVFSPSGHPGSAILEIDQLIQSAEEMKAGLRSFEKYVPSQLVQDLLVSGEEAKLGGERRTLTLFFADIAGFTGLSEKLEPEEVVEMLSRFHDSISDTIHEAGGTIDKFIGDSAMAFWGAPKPAPNHALNACSAALACQERLARMREKTCEKGTPSFSCRMGLHTGEVIVGNMGTQTRMNYTAIGDAVNLASRLEGLNKFYGTQILISQNTFEEVKDCFVARPIDRVSVKGRTHGVLVYELLGVCDHTSEETCQVIEPYTRGLTAYFERDWMEAACAFEEVLEIRRDDPPSVEMLARCNRFRLNPPPGHWDGTHRMEVK